MTSTEVDMRQVDSLVDKAINAATPAGQYVQRRSRPESDYTWTEPAPGAGLQAALAVAQAAQRKAYRFALGLRGEGTSWRSIADLLQIPWSGEYSRQERAYELVRGPESENAFHRTNVYWHCRGPAGCGQYITDHGPYDGNPVDTETGHADNCRRHAGEVDEYRREQDRQEERDIVSDKATRKLAGDEFALSTVDRARWVITRGGRYQGWSTSETLAVALVLDDDAAMEAEGYSSRMSAVERVFQGSGTTPAKAAAWLATVRAAATGETR